MGIAQNILPRPVTTIWQKEDCLDRPLFKQTLRNYQPSVSLLHRTPEDYHERVNQRSTSHLTPMILILQVGRNIPWTTMTLNPEKQKTLKKPLKSCNGHLVYDYFRLGVGCHWQMWRVTFSSRLNCCRRELSFRRCCTQTGAKPCGSHNDSGKWVASFSWKIWFSCSWELWEQTCINRQHHHRASASPGSTWWGCFGFTSCSLESVKE